MRFKGLDLNLLFALDVLLTERSVSRAAEKLCLSQSATSGALARLREYFGDDLLVQVGRKMVPTPRASELSEKVRAALSRIDSTILQPAQFDPATAKRDIRIVASDYMTVIWLSKTLRKLTVKAPNLKFKILSPTDKHEEALEIGSIDFIAMPEPFLAKNQPSVQLFSDTYVVLKWEGNTAYRDKISKTEFYNAKHVGVSFPTLTLTFENWFIKYRGGIREIDTTVGSFSTLPFMLIETNKIALMFSRLASEFTRILPLETLPSPIDIPPLIECLQWNSISSTDQCLMWVRDEMIKEKLSPLEGAHS